MSCCHPSTGERCECTCTSTGVCACPPHQCTCPNCPRGQEKQEGIQKQTATKPGEVSDETAKMPLSSDIGRRAVAFIDLMEMTQFPSESNYDSMDQSLREPLHSLVQIRDRLIHHIKQGNINEENAKLCADHLNQWKEKHLSKEGICALNGADFSSATNEIPKGQEIIGKVIQQIHDLQYVIGKRLKEGSSFAISSAKIIGPEEEEGGGSGRKKVAQSEASKAC